MALRYRGRVWFSGRHWYAYRPSNGNVPIYRFNSLPKAHDHAIGRPVGRWWRRKVSTAPMQLLRKVAQ